MTRLLPKSCKKVSLLPFSKTKIQCGKINASNLSSAQQKENHQNLLNACHQINGHTFCRLQKKWATNHMEVEINKCWSQNNPIWINQVQTSLFHKSCWTTSHCLTEIFSCPWNKNQKNHKNQLNCINETNL